MKENGADELANFLFRKEHDDEAKSESCNHGASLTFGIKDYVERYCKHCGSFLVKYRPVKRKRDEDDTDSESNT